MASETAKPEVIPFDPGKAPVMLNLDAAKNAALFFMAGLILGYLLVKLRKL